LARQQLVNLINRLEDGDIEQDRFRTLLLSEGIVGTASEAIQLNSVFTQQGAGAALTALTSPKKVNPTVIQQNNSNISNQSQVVQSGVLGTPVAVTSPTIFRGSSSSSSSGNSFYDSAPGRFSVGEVPNEVFNSLNVHQQQTLNEGKTVNLNPAFFKVGRDNGTLGQQGTSILGAGRSDPGTLEQITRPSSVLASGGGKPNNGNFTVPLRLADRFAQTGNFNKPLTYQQALDRALSRMNTEQKAELRIKIQELNDLRRAGGDVAENPGEFGLEEEVDLNQVLLEGANFILSGIASQTAGIGVVAAGETLATNSTGLATNGTSGTINSVLNTQIGGVAVGTLLGAAAAAKLGHTVGQFGAQALGHIDDTDADDVGAAVGGAVGAYVGSIVPLVGTILGAFIGAAIGSFLGGLAGEKLHDGEREVGGVYHLLEQDSQFTGDPDKDFDKNLVLARFATEGHQGDDSVSDGLRIADRVVSEGDIKAATERGIRQLIEEGHMTKEEMQVFMVNDMVAYQYVLDDVIEPSIENFNQDDPLSDSSLSVPGVPEVFSDPVLEEAPEVAPFVETGGGPRPRRKDPGEVNFVPSDLINNENFVIA
jgi:hypothetical protein